MLKLSLIVMFVGTMATITLAASTLPVPPSEAAVIHVSAR